LNKSEMIEAIASECDISKASAQRALDAFTNNVLNALKKGDEVVLAGFGTFSVAERAPRKARNLHTNEEIEIPAKKVPKFKAGKFLKDAVE